MTLTNDLWDGGYGGGYHSGFSWWIVLWTFIVVGLIGYIFYSGHLLIGLGVSVALGLPTFFMWLVTFENPTGHW